MSDGKIFVSYRNDDAGEQARSIALELGHHFGDERVFFDKESLHRGDDWQMKIEAALEQSSVMVVIVGNNWLPEFDARRGSKGRRDEHRFELRTALQRGIPVVGVILDQAPDPRKQPLPYGLGGLLRWQWKRLVQDDFKWQMERVIQEIEELVQTAREVAEEAVTAPTTVTVERLGKGDFLDIAEAVRQVPPHSTILVEPGTYSHPVRIDHPVQIDCPSGGVVLKVPNGAAITSSAESGLVTGIEIVNADPEDGVGIVVIAGGLTVEDCEIAGGHLKGSIGIVVGVTASPTFRSCTVSAVKTGIIVRDTATPRFESCTVADVEQNGVAVLDGGNPVFLDLDLRGCGVAGIRVAPGGRGTFARCEIQATVCGAGIHGPDATPVFAGTHIHNVEDGVIVLDGGGGTFDDIRLSDNTGTAVQVGAGSDPTFRRATITSAHRGVLVDAGGRGVFDECTITASASLGGWAFEVGDGAAPVVRALTVSGYSTGGIHVAPGGLGVYDDCTITDVGDQAVLVEERADPAFHGLSLRRLRGFGVVAIGATRGRFEDCEIHGSTVAAEEYASAVFLGNGADPAFERLVVHGGSSSGVRVIDARGTFRGCEISGTTFGFSIVDGGPRVSDFAIHDTARHAVGVTRAGSVAPATFEDGTIHSSNAKEAVLLVHGADPTFRNLVIRDCQGIGVEVKTGATPTFEDCEITRTLATAISVSEKGNPTVRRARIHHIGSEYLPANRNKAWKRGVGFLKSASVGAHAVRIHEVGRGTFVDCEISDIQGISVELDVRTLSRRFEGCTVNGKPWPPAEE